MFTASELIYSQTVPLLSAEENAEVARTHHLSRLLRPLLGPLVPPGEELPDPGSVLDLACGEGQWVLDLAYRHPDVEVAGLDPSTLLINTPNQRACDQALINASFGVADLSRPPFDFSDASFDLINACFLRRCLEEGDFPPLLRECARLLKPGGFLRLVECEAGRCNSPAIETLSLHYAQAIERAGLRPIPANRAHDLDGKGALRRMLAEAGLPVCAERRSRLSFSVQEEAYHDMQQVITVFFELIKPFVLRMQVVSEDIFNDLFRQATCEMQLPTFEGHWHLLTQWGQKGEVSGETAQAGVALRDVQEGSGNDVYAAIC